MNVPSLWSAPYAVLTVVFVFLHNDRTSLKTENYSVFNMRDPGRVQWIF